MPIVDLLHGEERVGAAHADVARGREVERAADAAALDRADRSGSAPRRGALKQSMSFLSDSWKREPLARRRCRERVEVAGEHVERHAGREVLAGRRDHERACRAARRSSRRTASRTAGRTPASSCSFAPGGSGCRWATPFSCESCEEFAWWSFMAAEEERLDKTDRDPRRPGAARAASWPSEPAPAERLSSSTASASTSAATRTSPRCLNAQRLARRRLRPARPRRGAEAARGRLAGRRRSARRPRRAVLDAVRAETRTGRSCSSATASAAWSPRASSPARSSAGAAPGRGARSTRSCCRRRRSTSA